MSKTFGRKTVLARLLANENITVQQGNFETASFNPHTRVLSLPFWKDVSNDVYDLLVGHEVAHALETPALETPADKDAERSPKYPFSYLNIIEDVRIEKLILRRYPGLVGNFKRGYKEMIERDFFKLKYRDPNSLGFMDRLNIFAKTRGLIDINFTAEEQVWVDRSMSTETFEEVVKLTEEIALWLKYQEHKKQQQQEQSAQEPEESEELEEGEGEVEQVQVEVTETEEAESGDEGQETDAEETESEGDGSSEDEAEDETEEAESGAGESEGEETEDEAETDGAGDSEGDSDEETDADSDQVGDQNGDAETENDPSGDPLAEAAEDDSFDPDDYDLDEAETEGVLENTQEELSLGATMYVAGLDKKAVDLSTIGHKILIEARERAQVGYSSGLDTAFAEFRQSLKATVGPMVKEFEMRKAAYRTARSRTATKGSLDVNKLHKYRYDDQLFKQVSYLADAKNHGMIMLVDHSGSMSGQIAAVRRQILILATFCKRVGIPFEVYGFTTPCAFKGAAEIKSRVAQKRAHFEGKTHYADNLILLELLSSRMSKGDYEKAFRQIFNQTKMFYRMNGGGGQSEYDYLGYTPLDAAIGAMRVKIKEFRKRHHVEKMNLVVLTDGEDSGHSQVVTGNDGQLMSKRRSSYILDVDGKMIDMSGASYGRTGMVKMVELIKSMGVKVFNFYISQEDYVRDEIKKSTGRYPMSSFAPGKGEWDKTEVNRAMREIRDTGVAIFDGQYGFDRRFLLPTNNQDFNGKARRLRVTEDMTANKAGKALTEANKSKRQGRIIAQKFCELVA